MHGAFWRGKTRDEFVAMNVMGLPIVSVGDPAASHLVRALRGLAQFGRNLEPRPVGGDSTACKTSFPRQPKTRSPLSSVGSRRVVPRAYSPCRVLA